MVAALSADTGEIIWRQVLERDDRGKIQYLHFINDETSNSNSVRLSNKRDDDGSLITVTGTTLILMRGWNVRTGNLAWEWSFTPNTSVDSHWFYEKSIIYQVVPSWGARTADVFEYNVRSGLATPKRIQLRSSQASDCDFIQSYLVCSTANEILSTNLKTGDTVTLAKSTSRQQLFAVSKRKCVLLEEFSNQFFCFFSQTQQSFS